MKNIKGLLLITVLMVLGISCTGSDYDIKTAYVENKGYKDYLKVIDTYYKALETGNQGLINSLFVKNPHLPLERKLPQIRYRILAARSLSKAQVGALNNHHKYYQVESGDLEVVVEEVLKYNSEKITFILKNIDGYWKIYTHTIGSFG